MNKRKPSLTAALLLSFIFCLPFAAGAAEVVLYSSNQPELLDMVSQGFEKRSGIKVTVVRLGTGEAMKRIGAEKNNPLADIFWSGDVAVLEAAKENFMPYDSPEGKGLPAGYVAADKRWTASNTQLMILMVNTRLVKPEEMPKSWADILSPKWKDKVVMADPAKSGSAYAQIYGLYKLYGWDGLARLVENARILDSSSLVYKGTAEGEFAVGITMEYAAYRYVAGGSDSVKIIYPSDGVISAPEGAALVAGARHEKEACAFFDYLLSKDVVSEIFAKYYRRPARPDAGKIAGLPALAEMNVLKEYSPAEANSLQKELLAKWRELALNKK
ncbi:MAG: extracellular solute-binding protein [Desulfovibrio sp.]|jgi:iron(III) transport system substrate-binding protein|nr:extracellular solute-binding protein [Desulfovibrio sp.]